MVDLRQSSRALSGEPNTVASFTPTSTDAADTALLDPWLLSETDLPWLRILFKKKYDLRYDPLTTESWFRNIVMKNPTMFYPVRLSSSFLIAMLACLPWLPSEFDCHIICVCADDGAMWETVKLLRGSIEWARNRKCTSWLLAGDTAFDLAPMAKRLGANELSPRFCIKL
jgi:hypothetical protein